MDINDDEQVNPGASLNEQSSSSSDSASIEAPQFINLNVHKAGLDGLDKDRINKIIQDASKGSHFYTFQQKRQKRIDRQVLEFKKSLKNMNEKQLQSSLLKTNEVLEVLETKRVLNKIIVHFDMDMFFAAVEIKHNPTLAEKPMAVGSLAMISTSNYVARRFGVRSAMAGFIAKKLCPQLVLVKPNFGRYRKESDIIMDIISEYDPNMNRLSLDEVYIDLTAYAFDRYSNQHSLEVADLYKLTHLPDQIWSYAYDLVTDIRNRIFRQTSLTVSAGISCNTLLAKVCTDINKPNGQFMVKGCREEVLDFVAKTEVRKFPGVGPVRGQILLGLGINTGKDLFDQRGIIMNLFSEHNATYYLRLSLGIGCSFLEWDDSVQKSHSRERTVGEMYKFDEISDLLCNIAQRLSSDLKSHTQQCRTITLKLKKVTFEVFLKSKSINTYTDDANVIFNVAKELLSQEISRSPLVKYRLIGMKVSNLKEKETVHSEGKSSQQTLSQLLMKNSHTVQLSESTNNDVAQICYKNDEKSSEMLTPVTENDTYQCRLCEQTFHDALTFDLHRHSCEGDLQDILNDDNVDIDINEDNDLYDEKFSQLDNITNQKEETSDSQPSDTISTTVLLDGLQPHPYCFTCPICLRMLVFENNDHLNSHIDTCLNKEVCIQLTQVPLSQATTMVTSVAPNVSSSPTQPNVLTSKSKRRHTLSQKSSKFQKREFDNVNQLKINNFFVKK